jgi:hypothetical protein
MTGAIMRQRIFVLVAFAVLVCGPACLPAAQDPAFSKDLTATIALQGLPCDKVIQATRNGDSDYTATCQNGNRYHVFVDASGRVVVKKL